MEQMKVHSSALLAKENGPEGAILGKVGDSRIKWFRLWLVSCGALNASSPIKKKGTFCRWEYPCDSVTE